MFSDEPRETVFVVHNPQQVEDAIADNIRLRAENRELAATVAVLSEYAWHVQSKTPDGKGCRANDCQCGRDKLLADLPAAAKALQAEASLWRQVKCERCEGHGERRGVEYNGDTPEQVMVACIACKGSGLKETKALLDRLAMLEYRDRVLVDVTEERNRLMAGLEQAEAKVGRLVRMLQLVVITAGAQNDKSQVLRVRLTEARALLAEIGKAQ